jgi:hypothetical protein
MILFQVLLNVIIMLAECKNLLRLVSRLFKSHAEEGTTKIAWKGPDEGEEEPKPNSLMETIAS